MQRILVARWSTIATVVSAACAFHAPSTNPTTTAATTGPAGGLLPANHSLTLDAGVSDVRVVVEARDSVSWSFDTRPAGCATAVAEPGRLRSATATTTALLSGTFEFRSSTTFASQFRLATST